MAVKVIFVPGHVVVEGLAAMLTPAVSAELITVVIAFEVAGLAVTHVALDVRIHVTISLLFKVELENVDALVPTLPPFTCH